MFSLLGVHYYFRLTSVYYVKSTKQILAGVRPPSPLFGNAKILTGPVIALNPQGDSTWPKAFLSYCIILSLFLTQYSD